MGFLYGTDRLTVSSALALAQGAIKGSVSGRARERVLDSQAEVEAILHTDRAVYGVNTGFGILAHTRINEADTRLFGNC